MTRSPVRSVAVVVPARNAANHLPLQLAALSRQTYRGTWRVVVADNGSSDDTRAVADAWHGALPSLEVVDATAVPGEGPGHARNVGAAAAGEVDALAFCDADDIVETDWLENLVAGLEEHSAVGGRLEYARLNPANTLSWHHHLQHDGLPDSFGFLPYAISANFAVRAQAFREVGGFDEGFVTGSDDIDLCWRLQQAGHSLVFVPDAVVHYLHRSSFVGLARQGYGYGVVQPRLYLKHRAHGMRWKPADAYRPWKRLVREVPRIVSRRSSARRWVRDVAFRLGRVVGSVRYRTKFF